jgi:hypothetical protein
MLQLGCLARCSRSAALPLLGAVSVGSSIARLNGEFFVPLSGGLTQLLLLLLLLLPTAGS